MKTSLKTFLLLITIITETALMGACVAPSTSAVSAPPADTSVRESISTPVSVPEEQIAEPLSPDFYYGTWAVTGADNGSFTFTLDELIKNGVSESLADTRLIFNSKGYLNFNGQVGLWTVSDNGVAIGSDELVCSNGKILLPIEEQNLVIFFEKISDEQEFSKEQQDETTDKAQTNRTGIRPEFKAAMDSYEAFYDDYFSFMEEYAKNPADFSLLMKYSSMISRAEEMDKAFSAWSENEMSSEELQYYLDVSFRIEKKLLNLF